MTEEEALQRLRAQDTAVLHWLIGQYNRYVASIIRAVLGKTCREEDAEELTADVFYSVFRRAGSISPGKLQAYLGAAARNRAKDFLRKQKPLEADLDELTLPDGEGTAPEAELLRRERQMRVKEAIFSMEPVDREIFLRYYYYLQPAPEIAEAMRLTPGAGHPCPFQSSTARCTGRWPHRCLPVWSRIPQSFSRQPCGQCRLPCRASRRG